MLFFLYFLHLCIAGIISFRRCNSVLLTYAVELRLVGFLVLLI
jgi:hypothetical protein